MIHDARAGRGALRHTPAHPARRASAPPDPPPRSAVVAALLGAWAFVALAWAVGAEATQAFDDAALRQLDALRAPWVDALMVEVTALGDNLVVLVLAATTAAVLWLTRHRSAATLLAVAAVGGVLLNALLKAHFDRPRPQVVSWGTEVATSSFPSGHATNAIVVYGTVAYLVARMQRGRPARAATALVASIAVLLVAASRLILGVHYPTDVAAGLAIGLAWAAACLALLGARHRRARRRRFASAADEPPPARRRR